MTHVKLISGKAATVREHLTNRSDSRCTLYKSEWFSIVETLSEKYGSSVKGRRILEVGAGVHNPLASAILAVAKGAAFAVGAEPGRISTAFFEDALTTSLIAGSQFPAAHILSSITHELVMRVVSPDELLPVNIELAASILLANSTLEQASFEGYFDIFHSNAVLEHIMDFEGFLKTVHAVGSPRSLHIHKIDFIDHRFYDVVAPVPIDGFRFLLKNEPAEDEQCNRLRISEMIDAYERHGFELLNIEKRWLRAFPDEYFEVLPERFRSLDRESLETIGAIVCLRKL